MHHYKHGNISTLQAFWERNPLVTRENLYTDKPTPCDFEFALS